MSTIVPVLQAGTLVTTPRHLVQYVATEYGAVDPIAGERMGWSTSHILTIVPSSAPPARRRTHGGPL
jgi:hypothetical protein